ncbi:hypothetical protein PQO03_04590 [Lentisphaera profundi]|uniref:DUF5640 domain-containing protein n=1 Tax=Lentisphaera profundi TaxID=1658616 RepID=A0ABY7VTJ6_9BACT|nr:hypothetical protein [Lentisphaera profundi]WDE97231.1 hypothetical protein PQO03_04590 [Lentisphaera profundi]
MKRKTIANLPIMPQKKEARRFTLLSILLVLVIQFSLISWNTQKAEEQSVIYLNENIIGEWTNQDKVFNKLSFQPNGFCETLNFELPYEKISDSEYQIRSFNGSAAYTVKYIDWKTIEVQSNYSKKNTSIYTRKFE